MEKLHLVKEEKIFKTPRMEAVRVIYNNDQGVEKINHVIVRSRPSILIIVRKNGEIAFIKQFRSSTGLDYIELPAGLLEPGESFEEAARREAEEETGLICKDIQILIKSPSNLDLSKSDEESKTAIATACGESKQHLDEMESIDSNLIWLPEEEAFARMRTQLLEGNPFADGLYLAGHCVYSLMAYMLYRQKN